MDIHKYSISRLTVIVLLLICGIRANGQKDSCEVILDRVETLQDSNRLNEADSLLHSVVELLDVCAAHDNKERYQYLKGMSFYYHEEYDKAFEIFHTTFNKLDSLNQYNCDDYLKNAYCVAACFQKLNKNQESEETINNALLKCSDSWETCPYSMKMYKLLVDIYSKKGFPLAVEQLHNERQQLAINFFDYKSQSKESNKIKKDFAGTHNMYKNRHSKDSVYYNIIIIKARILRTIEEFEEAQICFDKANDYLNDNKSISNWTEKKLDLLYEIIWNSSDIREREKVVSYCEEYEKLNNNQEIEPLYIVYFLHGSALLGLKKFDQAIPLLRRTYSFLISHNYTQIPLFVMTTYYLAKCFYRLNIFDESIKYAMDGIKVYPPKSDENLEFVTYLYDVLGAAYLKTKDYDNAILFLEKSARLQQNINSIVDEETKNNIIECKKHIK